MSPFKTIIPAALCALLLSSCESREQRVNDAVRDGQRAMLSEKQEAQREIGKAEVDLQREQQKQAEKIAEAARKLDEARVTGSADKIAEAENELQKIKADASKAIAGAQKEIVDQSAEARKELSNTRQDVQKDVRDAAD